MSSGVLARQLCGREREKKKRGGEGGKRKQRQNKKEGGRGRREIHALREAIRCSGSGPIDSFFQGSFVLGLGGVGGFVWECPGAVWTQLGAQAASALGTASHSCLPRWGLGFLPPAEGLGRICVGFSLSLRDTQDDRPLRHGGRGELSAVSSACRAPLWPAPIDRTQPLGSETRSPNHYVAREFPANFLCCQLKALWQKQPLPTMKISLKKNVFTSEKNI